MRQRGYAQTHSGCQTDSNEEMNKTTDSYARLCSLAERSGFRSWVPQQCSYRDLWILVFIRRRPPTRRLTKTVPHACELVLHGHEHVLQRRHVLSELLLLRLERMYFGQKLPFLRPAHNQAA